METHFSVENKPLLNQQEILLQVHAAISIFKYLPLCIHTENQISGLTLWSLQKSILVYYFFEEKNPKTQGFVKQLRQTKVSYHKIIVL